MERRSNLEAKVRGYADSDIGCVLHLSTETLMTTMAHSLAHRPGMIASVTIQGLTRQELRSVGRSIIQQATEVADDQAKAAEADEHDKPAFKPEEAEWLHRLELAGLLRWSPTVQGYMVKSAGYVDAETLVAHTARETAEYLRVLLADSYRHLDALIDLGSVYYSAANTYEYRPFRGERECLGHNRDEAAVRLYQHRGPGSVPGPVEFFAEQTSKQKEEQHERNGTR